MSTPKSTPINSPMFYYHLAQATYENDPHKYLEKAFGGRKVQKLEKDADFGFKDQWKVRFFRDIVSGELIVGFRGTDNALNWGSDVCHAISDADKLFKKMGKKIEEWRKIAEKKGYGKNISTFVGHSAGGYFVSHVKKDWNVRRITLNGHKCERAGGGGANLTANLRIGGDLISKWPCGSVKDRYINVKLPEDPGLKKKILQEVHKLKCFAMAFAKDGKSLSDNWFKHPHPVAERSWWEISPDHFAAPLLTAPIENPQNEENDKQSETTKQEEAISLTSSREAAVTPKPSRGGAPVGDKLDEIKPIAQEETIEEEKTVERTPQPTTQPSAGGSGRELKKLGERCQERVIQAAQLTALNAAKNICKNAREKSVLEDFKNREFSTAIDKLEIASEAEKARQTFCESYLSIMSNVLKQGGCIILSGGYVNPLTTRYTLEFSISLIDSDAHTRREQLSNAVSNAAMNMITPIVDGVISGSGVKGERYLRVASDIILDQSPEETIENLVCKPVKQIAEKVLNIIPKNDFLDRPVDHEPKMKWGEWEGRQFLYEPGVLTQNCESDPAPIKIVRAFAEGGLQAVTAWGDVIVTVTALPVYLAGEKKMARDYVESYTSWINKNLLGMFLPTGEGLRNLYDES